MPQLAKMRTFRCPGCGATVQARAKEVWHACPRKRLADTRWEPEVSVEES